MYIWYSISASTRAAYEITVKAFKDFCRARGWSASFCPAAPSWVEARIAAEAAAIAASRGLSKKTLKRKLSALSSWHADMGFDGSAVVTARVERVIARANRYHEVTLTAQPLPISLPILWRVVAHIRANPLSYGGQAEAWLKETDLALAPHREIVAGSNLREVTYARQAFVVHDQHLHTTEQLQSPRLRHQWIR